MPVPRAARVAARAAAVPAAAIAGVRLIAPEAHPLAVLLTALTPLPPLGRPRPSPPRVGGARLRVALANLWVSNPRRAALGDALGAVGADVLVLEELKPPFVDELERAGLFEKYPHQHLAPRYDPQGIGLCSTLPLREARSVALATSTAVTATVDLAGEPVTLWGMHLHAPATKSGRVEWAQEFAAATAAISEGTGRAVVLGDFNATLAHPSLRRFVRAGNLVEAHAAAGRNHTRTWPVGRRVPPFMRLDHVFARGLAIATAGEFPIPGSDHRGVVADLVPANGAVDEAG